MRIRSILATGALATVAVVSLGSAANAATIDSLGQGFVGKGEVQSAFAMNNAALQKAVDGNKFTFSADQPTTQSLSQDVSESGTQTGSQAVTQAMTETAVQSATQAVSQELTCTYTNGNGTKVYHREGVRDAERTGTREGNRVGTREGVRTGEREGTRTGTQSGKQVGNLAADLNFENKKTGQYTGWFLKRYVDTPVYSEVGTPVWAAPTFDGAWDFGTYAFGAAAYGDTTFTGDYDFGAYDFAPVAATAWGEWDAQPGENPDDCLRADNAGKISDVHNVITPGAITDGAIEVVATTEGAITDGAITDGAITEGATTLIDPVHAGTVTNDGAAKVFVTYSGVRKGL